MFFPTPHVSILKAVITVILNNCTVLLRHTPFLFKKIDKKLFNNTKNRLYTDEI